MREHIESVTNPQHAYTIRVGGTVDGESMRDPIGYGAYQQHWENNVELALENIGDSEVVNPRLSIDGRRRWHSLDELVDSIIDPSMTDAEKARALWEFARRHRYHSTTADDEVKDTIKMLNIYGYTLCWDEAYTVSNLWQAAGLSVRRGVPHGHCTTEVGYDGSFHLLDSDEHLLYLLRDNETVASEEDLARDHDLVKRGHAYGILSAENRQRNESAAALFVYDGPRSGGRPRVGNHRMDCALRPGEALVWQWADRGKYHGYGDPPPRLSNGLWRFTPRLDADFARWCVDADNLQSTEEGLVPTDATRPVRLVYRLQTPYVIVGGRLTCEGDHEMQCAYARDGHDWHVVAPDGNLDPHMPSDSPATYSCYVRFEGSVEHLKHLAIELDLQMAPLSLPALHVGDNSVYYEDDSAGRHVRLTHRWQERNDLVPPAAPRLQAPIDGQSTTGTQPLLRWEAVPAADDYHIELGTDSAMRYVLSPVFEKLLSNTPFAGQTQWSPPENGQLNPGTPYFWRVRARSADGLWGPWSPTASFVLSAPGVPLDVELDADWPTRTMTLHWRANPRGNAPVRYVVYASDERGFTARDTAHEIYCGEAIGLQPQPANRVGECDGLSLQVVGPQSEAANRSYYRVVALDEHGTASGPSDLAAAPRPFIFSRPPAKAVAGATTHYRVQSLVGDGDLRCISDGPHRYQAAIRDADALCFLLDEGPDFVELDAQSGQMTLRPAERHLGFHTITLRVQNGQGGVDVQGFDIEVVSEGPK